MSRQADDKPTGEPPPGVVHVVHLVDADCDPPAIETIRVLAERLDARRFAQRVATVGQGGHVDWLARCGLGYEQAAPGGTPRNAAVLGRWLNAQIAAGVVHCHSPRAAVMVAAAALPWPNVKRMPLFVEVRRRPTESELTWLRRLTRSMAARFLVRSETLRDCLSAAGVPADRIALLRAGLEPDRLAQADRAAVRAALGLTNHWPVLLAGGWGRPADEQRMALWAGAILGFLYPNLRVLLPGDGPERERLAAWIGRAGFAAMTVSAGARFDWPALVRAADVFIHAADARADATPIGWAMLADLPVVAAATPAVSGLIEDGRNGLLFPVARQRDLAMHLRRLLTDEPVRRRLTARARADAHRLFDPAASTAEYARVYEQLTNQAPRSGAALSLTRTGRLPHSS